MPRLFISHSSKDNVSALAFQRWLVANGWAKEDVFIDLHGIGAGERWRDTLRKANASCEAVVLLASPASLDSPECQREMNLAEDLGKEVIVAILRDLEALHPHARLRKVHLIAPQSDRFTHPQPVPVHHQHQQMIARAVAAILRGVEQLLDFHIIEKILAALMRIGGLPHPQFRGTLYTSPLGRLLRAP